MTLGVIMLAHARLDRAGAVARHLAGQGAAVVVHLDPRTSGRPDFVTAVGHDVTVMSEHRADWGRFGMVAATLAAVRALLAARPDVRHVSLISGACLPMRPLGALQDHLAAHPGADFIESVPLSRDQWVEDGLSLERFTLYHPFSHRDQPRLFSTNVEVQRALRLCRRLPRGIEPHLGGQWWCLSRATLEAILSHRDLPRWERFFRSTWIPDESFFQTLVRTVRPDANPRPPLHLGAFNRRGRPHVFHDDHLNMLVSAQGFFARKIDPDAGRLYEHFLGQPKVVPASRCLAAKGFARARAERESEGRGLATPARLPQGTRLTRAETARPYLVIACDDPEPFEACLPTLRKSAPSLRLHGRLFARERPAAFAVPGPTYSGNLPGAAVFRDYRPAQFLSRIVWADRADGSAFLLAPEDDHPVRVQIVQDPNARIVLACADPGARLKSLCHGFPNPSGSPLPRQAWTRVISPGAAALEGAIGDLLASDWSDPKGWEVPG